MTSLPDPTSAPITVGIDVAKDTLEVAIGLNVPSLNLTNDIEGFDALLTQLATHRVALVVMEATGARGARREGSPYGLNAGFVFPMTSHAMPRPNSSNR
jgi:hypothetical protein